MTQNDNFSTLIITVSSRKIWKACDVNYLPDFFLKILKISTKMTFSHFLMDFSPHFDPKFVLNIPKMGGFQLSLCTLQIAKWILVIAIIIWKLRNQFFPKENLIHYKLYFSTLYFSIVLNKHFHLQWGKSLSIFIVMWISHDNSNAEWKLFISFNMISLCCKYLILSHDRWQLLQKYLFLNFLSVFDPKFSQMLLKLDFFALIMSMLSRICDEPSLFNLFSSYLQDNAEIFPKKVNFSFCWLF